MLDEVINCDRAFCRSSLTWCSYDLSSENVVNVLFDLFLLVLEYFTIPQNKSLIDNDSSSSSVYTGPLLDKGFPEAFIALGGVL